MKLLLAVDGSTYSNPPLQAVSTRPWPSGSMVRIVTVVEMVFPAGVPTGIAPDASLAAGVMASEEALQKHAEEVLRTARDTVAAAGLPVEAQIRHGRPGAEIVEEAKRWGADLVLIGSHGRSGIERILMGSVAHYVVAHAPCSVEVVRRPAA